MVSGTLERKNRTKKFSARRWIAQSNGAPEADRGRASRLIRSLNPCGLARSLNRHLAPLHHQISRLVLDWALGYPLWNANWSACPHFSSCQRAMST